MATLKVFKVGKGDNRSGVGTDTIITRIRLYLTALAGAVLILMLIVIWSCNSENGVEWDNVRQQITDARTVTGTCVFELVFKSDESAIQVSRFYFKDPGKNRHDVFKVADGVDFDGFNDLADLPVKQTVVTVQEGDKVIETHLLQDSEMAVRTIHSLANNEEKDTTGKQLNTAAFLLESIRGLKSEDITEIEERMINGSSAVGFKISFNDIPGFVPGTQTGIARIWTDVKTAVPILIEIDLNGTFQALKNVSCHLRVSNLTWNTDLPEDLFEIDPPEGWTFRVYDRTHEIEDSPTTIDGDKALAIKADQVFKFLKKETFTCGDQTNTVEIYLHEQSGLEFVLIPGGSFEMGSESGEDKEKPVHTVNIKSFLICRTECTQEAWDRISMKDHRKWKGSDLPIETVDWNDCMSWCRKAGLRLPTEAEWEYACRAGTTTDFSFGNLDSDLFRYCNYCDKSNTDDCNWQDKSHNDGYDKTAPVMSYKPNAFGIFDMHGNVMEWCQDKYHDGYSDAPISGESWESGGSSNRVIRGGCWIATSLYCRSAFRYGGSPDSRNSMSGFRPAFSCD